MAEILGDDQIRCGLEETRFVQSIQTPAGLQGLPHAAVDLFAGRAFAVDDGLDQDRFSVDVRRIVALVADPDQMIGQPQRGDDFGGSGQERDDAHGPQS